MSSQDYAPKKKISSFYPPQRHLMGPGPSEIHPRVFSAMGKPTIGYLDPVFVEMMEELKESLRYAFQTHNALTFPVSGPGSVGMEMCFVNMIDPGRQGRRVPKRRFRRPHDRERAALRRRRRSRRGPLGHAGGSAEGRGRAHRQSRCQDPRLRARRNVDRRAIRRQDARRARAQARRAHDRGRRHFARRHSGADRRMGNRCDLFGQPEVPVLHAGAVARSASATAWSRW